MVSDLFAGMGFAICGFVYLILILLMYIKKKKFRTAQSGIFMFLIIFTIIAIILEITYVSFMHYFGTSSAYTEIACRAYIISTTVWMLSFIYYVLCIGINNMEQVKKRERIRIILFIILLIVLATSYWVSTKLDIEYFQSNAIKYEFGGDAVLFNYAIGVVLIIITFIVPFLKRFNFLKEQKNPVYYALLFFIMTTLISVATGYDFNLLSFQFSFMITTLYFTIESQDKKMLNDLEISKENAEVADKAKTEFLTNMSHEIRTPMNTILGFSESLLNEDVLTEEIVKRDSKNIHDASINLLDLINNILDISRLESNKEELEEKNYDIKGLVFEVNSIISSKINNDTISFDISVDEDTPKTYYGDYSKIYKIITNIIINAIKYTNFGKISLDIKGNKNEENFDFEITISNTGHAMKEEEFNLDFNDFVKLGKGSDNNIDSVTLGLLVAKRLADIINAKIKFINETGHGTRYIIEFKQKIVDEKKVGNIFENNHEENTLEKINLSGKKIIVVDDNKINIKLAKRLLEGYNAIVDSAISGMECMEKVKHCKYDLILLDHMMPELDGVATLKLLKQSGYSIPPVVALTANSYTGIKEKYINEGFDDYLAKPINYKELNKLLNKFFNEK